MKKLFVKVYGEHACFTHPALKTERSTYPVMTPSAAEAVLRSIYWKPQFIYTIDCIHVLNEIKTEQIMRNEIKNFTFPRSISEIKEVFINNQKTKTQRLTEVLINPAYVIEARQIMLPGFNDQPTRIKHEEIFTRRVEKRQCFRQPFLGMKEFMCNFDVYNPETDKAIDSSKKLGVMLHYILYPDATTACEVITPTFFNAKLESGILHVPELPERYEFHRRNYNESPK